MSSAAAAGNGGVPQRTFLGHPVGLYVLFFTEMWERFSYYGMRALLILYMVRYFKWSQGDASLIYKWYTSLVYLTPLLGGFLADRILGNKRAVIIGAILMAVGHFLMAFEEIGIFYAALGFLIIGNGFFKPNMSTQVGRLYGPNDPRRDGAYTIFYMGINLGAFLSPLVCAWLKDNTVGGYHTGFTMAGIGMVLGLIIYLVGLPLIKEIQKVGTDADKPDNGKPSSDAAKAEAASVAGKEAGVEPLRPDGAPLSEAEAERTPSVVPWIERWLPTVLYGIGGLLALVAVGCGAIRIIAGSLAGAGVGVPDWVGVVALKPWLADNTLISFGISAICALIAGWIAGQVRNAVRDRILAILILGFFVVLFWAAFEQSGNAMNVWADMHTNRYLTETPKPPPLFPDEGPPPAQISKSQDFWGRWVTMWQLKPSDPSKPVEGWGEWLSKTFNPVSTEWFQSINALAIFVLAPAFAAFWVWTARRKMVISIPTKMAFGVLMVGLAFAVMIWGAQYENGPTSVDFNGEFPRFVEAKDDGQVWVMEAGKTFEEREPTPAQAGRLVWDAQNKKLNMTGVLADVECDRIVRQTAPAGWFEAVKQLQKQTQEQKKKGEEVKTEVKVVEKPEGLDMRYAGFHPEVVSFDAETMTLKANSIELADKDVKSLLLAAGEPNFRDAVNKLFQASSVHRVSSWWLVWFYILLTLGELCLSPVGLSMVSKLAPAKYATMLMGLWLLTSFFGNFMAGAMGELWGSASSGVIWSPTPYFFLLTVVMVGAAVLLFVLVRKVTAMMHGVN